MPTYVTHLKCGSIVEVTEVEGKGTLDFWVYCFTCEVQVPAGELDGDEDEATYYLVKAPE